MLIHFAFSSLKDDPNRQLSAVVDNILEHRRLKYNNNPEFIPVFQPHLHPRFRGKEVVHIPLESFTSSAEGAIANSDKLTVFNPQSDLYYLPYEVRMLCFIKISLAQLSKSPHSLRYGRFGIVPSDKFLKKNGVLPVNYYDEKSLFSDPLVVTWNLKFGYKPSLSPGETMEKKEIEKKILAFRKPASLFKSSRESRQLAVSRAADGSTDLRIVDVYDRYPSGYDFRTEKEWRIASSTEDFLLFTEDELFMVVVPDEKSKADMEHYFNKKWRTSPRVEVFPEL